MNWLKRYFGWANDNPFYKKAIFTHHKELVNGDILIDDRPDHCGAKEFPGRFIHFGGPDFPDWDAVLAELL
jgi:5'(3')-deoxyribonucleotidase